MGNGGLIINADDWGRDRETTDRMSECIQRGTVSSVSAMVFMADSARAAEISLARGIDAGLHLNFTTPFTASGVFSEIANRQSEIAKYLTARRWNQVIFNPLLTRQFAFSVAAQLDEFRRLYGTDPKRIDGHHHMHLCANVVVSDLLPAGIIARRNFSFAPGEKSLANRLYRNRIDRKLAKRNSLVGYLFSLAPLEPRLRLDRILALARHSVVELETHPINEDEYQFLMGDEVLHWTAGFPIASRFAA